MRIDEYRNKHTKLSDKIKAHEEQLETFTDKEVITHVKKEIERLYQLRQDLIDSVCEGIN